MKRIILLLIFFMTYLFAGYTYTISPSVSGVVGYKVYKRSDNSLYQAKDFSREDSRIKMNISVQGKDLMVKVSIQDSKFSLENPTIILFDSNYRKIDFRKFTNNSTSLQWRIPHYRFQEGTATYRFVYATNNSRYNFAFLFKPVKITKRFYEVITKVNAGSKSSNYKSNTGYVGEEFVFAAKLRGALPSSYGVYIAFMGVNENGNNSGHYSPFYRMSKHNSLEYYYRKVIQKPGKDRKYKICIRSSRQEDIYCKEGSYTVLKKAEPIYIDVFTLNKVGETKEYGEYELHIALTQEPTMLQIKTERGTSYYLVRDGKVQQKPSFVISMSHYNNKKTWRIRFRIYKSEQEQTKSFSLIAKRGESIHTKRLSFVVPAKKIDKPLQIESFSVRQIGMTKDYVLYKLSIALTQSPTTLQIKTEKEIYELIRNGKVQTLPSFMRAIKLSGDKKVWEIELKLYKFDKEQKKSFTLIAKNEDGGDSRTITLIVPKKDNEETLEKILGFMTHSMVLSKLDIDDKTILHSSLSRADAALLLYEFLKLKDSSFKLPYPTELYHNPFADIDPTSDYYEAVLTLSHYKGRDDIGVLTKKFGAFNPLQDVTRFQFVKMVVEGLNLQKAKSFDSIRNFEEFHSMNNEYRLYFATAVDAGLIKGESGKLLPFNRLTIYQALLILQRAINKPFSVMNKEFEEPIVQNGKMGNPLGEILELQSYDPDIMPMQIINVYKSQEGECKRLRVAARLDGRAKEFYKWSANFGFFIQKTSNNKEVLFCPATKRPDVDYKIVVVGTDGYMHFSKFTLQMDRDEFRYEKNIGDTHPEEITFNLDIEPRSRFLKEQRKFIFDKTGDLYKGRLKIGLERVSVVIQNAYKKIEVSDIQWDDEKIWFIVPSIEQFYGKDVVVKVTYGTNYKFKTESFTLTYQPLYIIKGQVGTDKVGKYPNYLYVNGEKVEIEKGGKFIYFAPSEGSYHITINQNYKDVDVQITDRRPVKSLYLAYIDRDYDNDGIENEKDAFPYDPAIAVDNDEDGCPDRYNEGYHSATLPLDKYPNDPDKCGEENLSSQSNVEETSSQEENSQKSQESMCKEMGGMWEEKEQQCVMNTTDESQNEGVKESCPAGMSLVDGVCVREERYTIEDLQGAVDFLLQGKYSAHYDLNGDGTIDIQDITQLIDKILNG